MADSPDATDSAVLDWEATALLDALPDALFVLDLDATIRRTNLAATKLLGIEAKDLLDKPFESIVADVDFIAMVGAKAAFDQPPEGDTNILLRTVDEGFFSSG